HGHLITKVLHLKETYRKYVGVDASAVNLMRPAFYDAYHHITVAGKEKQEATVTYDITGSLCENNDKFAKERAFPEIKVGD
ncbi:diaminopimelate decarboxylase, partial [Streptococcus thermophilus]|nr:diaminopimelate decarboxylase [Streptococcus thermophilus]